MGSTEGLSSAPTSHFIVDGRRPVTGPLSNLIYLPHLYASYPSKQLSDFLVRPKGLASRGHKSLATRTLRPIVDDQRRRMTAVPAHRRRRLATLTLIRSTTAYATTLPSDSMCEIGSVLLGDYAAAKASW